MDDIIAEILADFCRALNNPGDKFFREVSPTGRMQIIDSKVITYCRRVKKDDFLAAKVAIRCLIEDEFILLSTFQKAVKTMLVYVRDGGDDIMINGNRKRILKGLMSYMEKLDEEFEQGASHLTSIRYTLLRYPFKVSYRRCENGRLYERDSKGRRKKAI